MSVSRLRVTSGDFNGYDKNMLEIMKYGAFRYKQRSATCKLKGDVFYFW